MPTLLCRLPLFPDESLPSYLFRVVEANCYTYSTFTAICKNELSALGLMDIWERPKRAGTYDVLSSLTGIEPRALANASINRFSQSVPMGEMGQDIRLSDGKVFRTLNWRMRGRYFRQDQKASFCPACLRESPYHRVSWIPLDMTACLKHECLLLNGCGFCQAWISIQDIVKCHCPRCGKYLGKISTPSLHNRPFDLFTQGTLQSWWELCSPPTSPLWKLPHQPSSVLYRVFEGFKTCLSDKQQSEHFLGLADTRLEPHDLYGIAMRGMVDWPQGFFDLLHQYLNWKKMDGVCFHPYFSPPGALVTTWMLGLWTHERFEFIQEAFDQFLIENPALFETKIWRQRIETRPSFAERFPYLTKFKVAQILKLPLATVELLLLIQEIAAYDRQSGQDVWANREDVLRLQETLRRDNPK